MKVTTKWLKDFVDFDFSPKELAAKLTMTGTKVERLELLELLDREPLSKAIGLDEAVEAVIELELTPNRPDCLSLLGVAREISAIEKTPLRKPQINLDEIDLPVSQVTSVTIEAPDLCRRYAARIIKGVKIAPSPDWLQNRLKAIGLRPINNVVDVTNYVLMELGHPLHAFDLNKLEEKRIVVRRAKEVEKIVTIDGENRDLTDQMLVIADARKPVALAGVMGGLESEVSDETTDILLESAYFDPISIRKTSQALKMHTEASHRFERGADIEAVITAVNRAAQLIHQIAQIAQIAGGEILKGIVDVYPTKLSPLKLTLRPERVNFVLGTDITAKEMGEILERLEFKVNGEETQSLLDVMVPTFRPDVSREIDLIEEIARIYGYDKIPITSPITALPESKLDFRAHITDLVRDTLVACGLYEVLNYSFYGKKSHDLILLPQDSKYRNSVRILNPLTEEHELMRTTLIPSLLENVRWNLNRHVTDIAIFEISKAFYSTGDERLPEENLLIAGALSGQIETKNWNSPPREFDFFDLKGILEALMTALRIDEYSVKPGHHPTFHPGKTGELLIKNEAVGILGEVHPQVLQNYEISQRVFVFEVDLERLFSFAKFLAQFEPPSPFPSVYRDLAILVPQTISSEAVTEVIKKAGEKLIKSLRLFDVYVGPQTPEEMKSLAYSIEYHTPQKTLTDAEVDRAHQEIITEIERKIGGKLR